LIRSIRDTGFDWSPEAEMYVHVLDDGAFCWTSGGNHRLGVALALGLTEIPVRIRVQNAAVATPSPVAGAGHPPRHAEP